MISANDSARKQGLVHLLVAILVFGSLWGLSEVVVSGGLRAANFPYRSGLLTGIGMAAMGMSLATTRRLLVPLGVGLVAVMVGALVVPVLHVSIMCKANSLLAVGVESASLSLVAFVLMRKANNVYAQMATGALAALTAAAVFYFAGTHLAPCAYLLSFTPQSFLITEGLVWSAFSAILFPLGYLAGRELVARPLPALSAYYGTAAFVVMLCWGASALAIAAGL